MRALIIVAHGSKNNTANQKFIDFISKLKPTLRKKFDRIEVGFLEFSSPSLEDAIASIPNNHTNLSVTVFPYFLHSGNHVTKDIPEMIRHSHLAKADVAFLAPIGEESGMATLLLQILTQED